MLSPGMWVVLVASHEISHPHGTYDPHVLVQNEQILQVVLTHDFPSLIHRLIFEAVVGSFFHHTMDELCFAEIIRDRSLWRTLALGQGRVFRLRWCRFLAIDLSDGLNTRIKMLVLCLVLQPTGGEK